MNEPFSELENLINSNSEKDRLFASQILIKSDRKFIYQFLEWGKNTPHIKSIRTFYEDEKYAHVKAWSHKLKDNYFIGDNIKSMDEKGCIHIIDQYISTFFFDQYKSCLTSTKHDNNEALFWLNKACDLRFFYALIERCLINQEFIKKYPISDNHWTDHEATLLQDTQTLGNYYYALGNLHAAFVLLNVGIHLADQIDTHESKTDAQLKILAKKFYTLSLEKFFSTCFLLSLKSSKKISAVICREKDIAQIFKYNTLNDIQNHIILCIKDYIDDASYKKIRENTEIKIRIALGSSAIKIRRRS